MVLIIISSQIILHPTVTLIIVHQMILILVSTAAYSVRGSQGLDVCDGSDHYGSRRDERTELCLCLTCLCMSVHSIRSKQRYIHFSSRQRTFKNLIETRVTATTTDGRHNVAYVTFSSLLFYSKSFSKNEAKTRSLC